MSDDGSQAVAPDVTLELEVKGLSKQFGALWAVRDVDLRVARGARHAVIGPNGAGKSTLFNLIAGRLRPDRGSVELSGRDITRLAEHERNRRGLASTFQKSNVFEGLTVTENLSLAVLRQRGAARRLRWGGLRRQVDDRCKQLLELVSLQNRGSARASSLSHGHKRALEIALALATEPRLLLLDEPLAGMSNEEISRFVQLIGQLSHITVVIIEHNIDAVLQVASHITVLDAGQVIASGIPAEVTRSPVVQAAYLGVEHAEELFQI